MNISALQDWLWPGVFVAAGLVVGIVVDRLLQRGLGRLARSTRWAWDDTVTDALRHAPVFWFIAAGAYAAVASLGLPSTVANTLQKTLVALVIFSVTLVATRLAGAVVSFLGRRTPGGIPSSSLIANVARVVVFVLGVLIVLDQLGVNITPLITGLGIGGLAVALALQDTLSNLFSGFQIILTRQVVRGDYIQLESGEEGYVRDVKWRNTTIKSRLDDTEIVIPNRKLADAIVVNFSLPNRPLWLRIPVGVSYASDLEHVERVTDEVARRVLEEVSPDGEVERDPVIRFREFGDSSINLNVRLWVPEFSEQFRVRHEFVKRLHRRYEEEGIVIPFPMRTLEFNTPLRVAGEDDPSSGPPGELSSGPQGEPPSGPPGGPSSGG